MSPLNSFKNVIVEFTGLAKDALHIYIALALFLAACLIFGWRSSQWKPLLLVFAVAVLGEMMDIHDTLILEKRTYLWDNWHDIWNTMLAPTLLFLTARYTGIFEKPAPTLPPETKSGDEPQM